MTRMLCALLVCCGLAAAQDSDKVEAAKSAVFGVQARRMVDMRGRQFPVTMRQIAVAIGKDGLLLTHSLGADPQSVRVYAPGSTDAIDAEVVDSDDNFTLLRIERKDLKAATWSDWKPSVGQKLLWIGMLAGPQGRWTPVVKEARVDAVIEDPTSDQPLVYSDPPFNGPIATLGALVLNGAGEMIGVVAQASDPAQQGGGRRAMRRGGGMPVIRTAASFSQYLTGSGARRGMLGVSVETLTDTVAEALGMKDTRGAIVTQVTPGSGAEKAGIKAQDVIVKIGAHDVISGTSLQKALAGSKAGDTIAVEVMRVENDKAVTKTVQVVLTARDDPSRKDRVRARRFGFTAAPLTANVRRTQQLAAEIQGVYVRRVTQGSPASLGRPTGLRRGDVIERVGDMPVPDLEALKKALAAAVNGAPVQLFVRHATATRFVEITPEAPTDDG